MPTGFRIEIDFISQNKEIEQSFVTTCRLYPGYRVRFVGDSGLDDQKMFAQVGRLEQEFVFRVSHLERIVEVYNARLDRWEREVLQDLTETVLYQATFQVLFKHAGRTRLDTVHLGWFPIRLPEQPDQILWVLVADDPHLDRQLVLITNVPLDSVAMVQQVYNDWRLRSRIEHGYRFDQPSPDVLGQESKAWMWKICACIPSTACAVCLRSSCFRLNWCLSSLSIGHRKAVLWLRQLGGKLGLPRIGMALIGCCMAFPR